VVTILGKRFLGNFQVGGWKVKIVQGTSQVNLYRMLVAGLVYDQGGLSLEEVIALFDLQGRLEQKVGKDPQFTAAYENNLSVINAQLRKVRFQSFPAIPNSSWKKETTMLLKEFLPGQHDYFGWARNPKRRTLVKVIAPNPLQPPKKRPAKSFIGVGQRDSGNRRDPAKDGVTYKDLMKAGDGQVSKVGRGLKDQLLNLVREHEKVNPPRGRG
jgi:hypothetical protein